MGRADRLVLETQLAGADGVDVEGIRKHMQEMARIFREIRGRKPFPDGNRNDEFPMYIDNAIEKFEGLASVDWTPSSS